MPESMLQENRTQIELKIGYDPIAKHCDLVNKTGVNLDQGNLRQQWGEERAYRTGIVMSRFGITLSFLSMVLNFIYDNTPLALIGLTVIIGCATSLILTNRLKPKRQFVWWPFYIAYVVGITPSIWMSGSIMSPWLGLYISILIALGCILQTRFNPIYNILFALLLVACWGVITKYFPYPFADARMHKMPTVFITLASMLLAGGLGYLIYALIKTERDLAKEIEKKYAELYEARANLIREESANQSKSAFLANVSHELRTPLGAILGYASILREDGASPEEKRDFAHTIERSSLQLARLVDDLLDLSKIEAGRLEIEKLETRPLSVIKEVIDLFLITAKSKNLRLETELRGEIPTAVKTDPFRLKQILTNLVGNALKFTTRGSVEILIEFIKPGSLVVKVKDTGRGIADIEREKLFKPFSQADASMTRVYGGTGLGLNFSRKLARLLGGDLELTYSALGVGSEFTLQIPVEVIPEHLVSKTLPEDPSVFDFKNTRILIVDDNVENRRVAVRYLSVTGALVDEAADGVECLEMALRTSYDIILMDLQMPRMDGLTATSRLRSHGFPGTIIALTAHAMKHDRDFCLSVGCDAHMAKPLQRIELLKMVHRFSKGRANGHGLHDPSDHIVQL